MERNDSSSSRSCNGEALKELALELEAGVDSRSRCTGVGLQELALDMLDGT